VSLAQILKAAKLDPAREQGVGTPGCETSVKTFEHSLALLGYLNRKYVDGSYGSKTFEAVRRFQENIGDAELDGVPGPLQLASLADRSGAFLATP
jgi:peptidoglycan hydrolase-like protein with peptidoglycan-binding domain